MDAITDILSNIFVDKKQRYKSHNQIRIEKIDKVSEEQPSKNNELDQVSTKSMSSLSNENALADSLSSSESSKSVNIKMYNLKASELYNKNMLITSADFGSNVQMFHDILYKFSCMKNIKDKFNTTLNVITKQERKKYFKKLLIENPDLHFTNFNVKTEFTTTDIKKITRSELPSILVVDLDDLEDLSDIEELFLLENIRVIALSSVYELREVYKVLNTNRECVLMNKKDISLILQKRFYLNIVKRILNIDLHEYLDVVNSDDEDIKYIYIRDSELLYY